MNREFHIDRPFVASGLVHAGRRYKQGEPFDWRKAKLSEGDLWDLWVLGLVDNAAPLTDAELERMTAPEPRRTKR